MKRKVLLDLIRIAAYEGDMHKATLLYCENHIGRRAFEDAVDEGRQQATSGMFAKGVGACPTTVTSG